VGSVDQETINRGDRKVKSYRNGVALATLVGALALAGAACGSSSKTTATPTTTTPPVAQKAPAATSTVTSIEHLTGVGTTVELNASTMAALKSLGVKVATTGTAKLSGSAVTFPITSGYVEIHSNHSFKPGYIVGSVEHYGSGLTFSAGGKSLSVSDFVVDPGNSVLYASVGTTPDVPLLTLDGANVKVSMQGSDVVLNGTVAKLTQTAASALDKTFGTTAVKAGLPLGVVHLVASGTATTYSGAATEVSRLTGTSTSVALDPSTVKALTSLGVAFAPSGTATFTKSTSEIHFPITGGVAVIHTDKATKPGWIDGVLIHQGSGFTLTKGKTTVSLSNFVVDPGNSTLTGTVDGTEMGVPLLSLNGSAVKVSTVGSTVHLDGTVADLTATAAAALNKAFATTGFQAGIELGVVHIIAS
jgi:hypothetical protein